MKWRALRVLKMQQLKYLQKVPYNSSEIYQLQKLQIAKSLATLLMIKKEQRPHLSNTFLVVTVQCTYSKCIHEM